MTLAALFSVVVTLSGAEKKPAKKAAPVRLVTMELRSSEKVYKTTPQGELKLHFHFPPGWTAQDRRPAVIFFFGGGWQNGSADQFLPQAEYFASRGLVTARADYRVFKQHGTTPDKCVEDAKSAMRWLRTHADQLGIDPQKLISAGGSAGGHLAAAVAVLPGFNAPEDDLKVSSVPQAMLLFNPALDLTLVDRPIPDASGKDIAREFSPTLHLKRDAPPAVIFFGSADKLKQHGDDYLKKASNLGVPAEQWIAAGQGHGFFNRQPWTAATVIQADRFLASLGYLKGEPTIKVPDAQAVLIRSN